MSLLQMSITAGMLVIIIVLIRAVALNKLPKTAFLILWGVVLIRLLIPVSIPVQFCIYSSVTGIANTVISNGSPTLPESVVSPVSENTIDVGVPAVWIIGQPEMPEMPIHTYEVAQQRLAFSIAPLTAIWLTGTLAALIFFTVISLKNHRMLRCAMRINNDAFLNMWLDEHRLLRPIRILQSDKITTPLAVGLFKPRIILPKCMDMNDKQLLRHVLLHEYYHIKRLDALWKLLLILALSIHWLNPLVWVMFILANRELELTCDEMVLRHFGVETKTAYAYSIISMAEQRSRYAFLHSGFSKNAAEERITSIMKIKKSSVLGVLLSAVLICVLTFGTLAVLAANTDNDIDSYLINDAAQSTYATEAYIPSQPDENGFDDFYQQYDETGVLYDDDDDNTAMEADICVVDGINHSYVERHDIPHSPYRIANTLEEIRAIQALGDGSVFVTNIMLSYAEIMDIRHHRIDGIILTCQDLEEAVDILHQYYLRDGRFIRNFDGYFLLPPPPPLTPEEEEAWLRRNMFSNEIWGILRSHFGIGEDEGGWGWGGHDCMDATVLDLVVTLHNRNRFYELQLNRETGEVFNLVPIADPSR